jgi:hypothetical protein
VEARWAGGSEVHVDCALGTRVVQFEARGCAVDIPSRRPALDSDSGADENLFSLASSAAERRKSVATAESVGRVRSENSRGAAKESFAALRLGDIKGASPLLVGA